jgi:hypothetical protein
MLQLENSTPLKATFLATADSNGIDSIVTVIKGTFDLKGLGQLTEEQVPILLADEYSGEPGHSSVNRPSDIGLPKLGTDVLLVGHAYSDGSRPTLARDVQLMVGPINKTVRVFGRRVWQKRLFGVAISEMESFDKLPLMWEHAFGGLAQNDEDPPKLESESRNPVGRGFYAKKSAKEVEGVELPNLENPNHLLRSWKDRPPPAGFGVVSPMWQPRLGWAGTYDESWQRNRAPFLPNDFDSRFLQVAPVDQVAPNHLQGGELVRITGVIPNGDVRFELPRCRIEVLYSMDNQDVRRGANLDMVLIEPDMARVVLVWRAALACDKKLLKVREIGINAQLN